jgi:hypothetical protein
MRLFAFIISIIISLPYRLLHNSFAFILYQRKGSERMTFWELLLFFILLLLFLILFSIIYKHDYSYPYPEY